MTKQTAASLEVITPGLMDSVQDLGRFGHQAQGVPVSGALDSLHLRLANALVGNELGQGALEIRFSGPTLEVNAPSVRIAFCGTEGFVDLLGSETIRLPANQSHRLVKGDIIRIGAISDSAVCYLAVEGGFNLPLLYGSQSTYLLGKFGGFHGRSLQPGDLVPLTMDQVESRAEAVMVDPPQLDQQGPIRVVLGPQDDYFSKKGIKTFLSESYQISSQSNRMGLRLGGPAIEHEKGFNINSDGIVTGAIQVPGTGQPILLLSDHQTTGGYPKIATVVSVDLPRLGRAAPGAKLTFRAISVAEAEQARRQQEQRLQAVIAGFEYLPPGANLLDYLLANRNLISGTTAD